MADIFIAPKEKQATPVALPPTSFQKASGADAGKSPGMLTAFCPYPGTISFNIQDPSEEILLFLRRHFITNVPWIISIVALLLIPMLILFVFHFTATLLAVPNPGAYTLVLFLFYYLAVITIGFVYFISWFYNISLVTTEKVVDIDFSGLVYKDVAATKINLVEDVSFSQIGVIPSLFDFGNVLIQTAGTLDNFDFEKVPHPGRVVDVVEELIGKEDKP